jgi:hypothetical protein
MGVKIYSYIQCFPDDQDVLADALNSLVPFSSRIYLIDGGMTQGTLCHHPRFTGPLKEWIVTRPEFSGYGTEFFTIGTLPWTDEEIAEFKKAVEQRFDDTKIVPVGNMTLEISGVNWAGVPITIWENDFLDPGNQRNWIIRKMESEPEQPDWVCWIDSDEVCSDQFISGIRDFLEAQPSEVTNVVPQWLNLIVDEQHIAGGDHSSWLAHGRLYRPGTVYFNNGWHEHQYYQGRRVQFDTRIIHTRGLYRKRLLVQRGHPRVSGHDRPLWGDVVAPEPIPAGVTWRPLHWPDGERVLDFNTDALTVWNERGELIGV